MGQLLTCREIAEKLRLKEDTIRHKVASRRIPFVKISKNLLFDSDRINEWLQENSVEPIVRKK